MVRNTSGITNKYDIFNDYKLDSLSDSIHADTGDRKFSLDSTYSLFNDVGSKLKTGSDQSYACLLYTSRCV